MRRRSLSVSTICLALLLAGCAVTEPYQVPTIAIPAHFKEAPGWVPAAPADNAPRGAWWTAFGDPVLNDLAEQVAVSNQNVASAAAAVEQARALVREQRAALLPVVSFDGGASRASGATRGGAVAARPTSSYQLSIGASWDADVWGRLRTAVDAAGAAAEASAADLAAARLSAQGELAANYFQLRQADRQITLLRDTIAGYERVLQITRNRYEVGVAPKTDVLQSQTLLANARAEAAGLARQRAQLEHAIAVLLGRAPADFTLPAHPETVRTLPAVPPVLPSTLLQRRPDIAAAERRVAAANAQIGIARSAYFPSIGLAGSFGSAASTVGGLIDASTTLWSIGLSAAQTLFNAGATDARVDAARAAHQGAVARYRQTVLNAFRDVEDQLSALQILEQQEALRREASEAADQAEAQQLNRYRAGQVSYTEVVNAQATALNARRALAQVRADRETGTVGLILAAGGGV